MPQSMGPQRVGHGLVTERHQDSSWKWGGGAQFLRHKPTVFPSPPAEDKGTFLSPPNSLSAFFIWLQWVEKAKILTENKWRNKFSSRDQILVRYLEELQQEPETCPELSDLGSVTEGGPHVESSQDRHTQKATLNCKVKMR